MTVNLATAVYKSTGSTTGRSLGDRAADIINVKDYGAVGNGITDDTVAIQAAFTAAFGAWNGTPHGNTNRALNAPVYFPAGLYNTSSPLYLVEVYGGMIFGEGPQATTIHFSPISSGNAILPNPTATFTGSISGTTLTVTTMLTGPFVPDTLLDGSTLSGAGVTAGTAITVQTGTPTPNGTNGVGVGTFTFVDATANAFTPAMVGTQLQITAGSGFTIGGFRIKTYVSSSTVTLNISPGTGTGATWHLNGWTGTYTVTPSNSATGVITISAAVAGSEITPCIMTNGYGYMTWQAIDLIYGGATPDGTVNQTGFYYYSNVLMQPDGATSTACTWRNMSITNFWVGMFVGWGINSGANQENCILENVTFSACLRYGLRLLNQNVLNWISIGGGAVLCGTDTGGQSGATLISGLGAAAYSINGASITIIRPSMSGNGFDFVVNSSAAPFALMGGSTESAPSHGTGQFCLGIAGAVASVDGFTFRNGYTSGYTMVTLISATVVLDGCFFSPGTSSAGILVDLGSNGVAVIDSPYYGSNAVGTGFAGSGDSLIFYRGNGTVNTTPFTGFSGRIAEYVRFDGGVSGAPKVSDLPTAAAIWKGVRMVVTDSTVAASGNFGAIVAGTSTHTVPVFCDGTNWLIG